MAGNRRSRIDEDDDDRPRRRRDDDEEDRPSRRRYEDEEDERPRSRGRWEDEDDLPRRPRRKSRGPSIGKVLAIVCGVFALVAVVVTAILLATGAFSSGRADISYDKYTGISQNDTVEGLAKKFGRPEKYDRASWGHVTVGSQRGFQQPGEQSSTLADYSHFATEVTAWYGWRKGQEELYLAEGTDKNGRRGLVIKIYYNPKVVEDAFRNPNAPKSGIPWFQLDQIGVGGGVRFGGG